VTRIRFTKITNRVLNFSASDWMKLILICAIVFIAMVNRDVVESFLEFFKNREAIIEKVDGYGVLGPIFLGTVIFIQIIFAVIPGHLLMFACGYLYGFVKGFLLTYIITVFGCHVTFLIARRAGKPIVYRLCPKKLIDKWDQGIANQGIVFFTFSFILPIFPSDVMSYVAGLTNISSSRYLVANMIGHIPVAVLMNLAGAYGFELTTGWAISIVVVGIVSLILWLRYQKRFEEKLNLPQE